MAKIIKLPVLSEHERSELIIQVLELREKLHSVVYLMAEAKQQDASDLIQHLLDELTSSQSMITNVAKLLPSDRSEKK